ncbi:hypothetical protein [Aureispira anguillae]|nr:hypothetical protein [Aureispira anguillae]
MLWIVLVAFQLYPQSPPQVKTKSHKFFLIKSDQPILEQHTETKYNIHGEIIEYAEYIENDKGKPVLKQLKLIKYNVEGLYIGTMVYDNNNALIWSEENTYNEADQVVKITHTKYEETPIVTYTVLSYDKDGHVVLSKTFDQKDSQVSEQKRTYAATGELISAISWTYVHHNSKVIKKTISLDNVYNNRGQIIQSTLLSQEGKERIKDIKLFKNNAIIDWTKYRNGRLISQFTNIKQDSSPLLREYKLPPPIPQQKIILEYDDAKRDPLENIPHTPFKTVTFKNNKLGLPTKRITRTNNQVSEVIYYSYNEVGLLISEKKHDKLTHDIEEIQYEYDPNKNPTIKKIFYNGLLTQQHLYSYEYYHQR